MHAITIQPGSLQHVRQHAPVAHAFAVIADSNVAELHGKTITKQFPNSHLLTFPAGEANKTRETWAALTDQMLARGLGRDCCVIAVGGGVTCDLAGFVAATYVRGVPVVQVPTSLLAMIDAAIGGKTGVDVASGKNLVGAFHEPHAVIIDPLVLQTLPDEELSNGLAEAVKHGAIADATYLNWIAESAALIFERRPHTLESLIKRSVEIKAAHVEGDLREAGKRAALNFGHTIGHAFEHVLNYQIAHGTAVAIGMMAEAEIGVQVGVTQEHTAGDIGAVLDLVRVPSGMAIHEVEPWLEATRSDKKARAGAARYVLLEKPGNVARTESGEWTWAVPDDVVREALKQFCV
jgi:3-dehydroquinate synthase